MPEKIETVRRPIYCVLSIKDLRRMIARIETRQIPNRIDHEITCGSFHGTVHEDSGGKLQVNFDNEPSSCQHGVQTGCYVCGGVQ